MQVDLKLKEGNEVDPTHAAQEPDGGKEIWRNLRESVEEEDGE